MKALASILLLIALLITSTAFANPPNKIDLSYDKARGELNVQIEHFVSNRKTHFIKEIVLYKNGKLVKVIPFDFQTSLRNQTIPPIKIAAKDGDSLEVVALCNKSGEGKKSVTVGK